MPATGQRLFWTKDSALKKTEKRPSPRAPIVFFLEGRHKHTLDKVHVKGGKGSGENAGRRMQGPLRTVSAQRAEGLLQQWKGGGKIPSQPEPSPQPPAS